MRDPYETRGKGARRRRRLDWPSASGTLETARGQSSDLTDLKTVQSWRAFLAPAPVVHATRGLFSSSKMREQKNACERRDGGDLALEVFWVTCMDDASSSACERTPPEAPQNHPLCPCVHRTTGAHSLANLLQEPDGPKTTSRRIRSGTSDADCFLSVQRRPGPGVSCCRECSLSSAPASRARCAVPALPYNYTNGSTYHSLRCREAAHARIAPRRSWRNCHALGPDCSEPVSSEDVACTRPRTGRRGVSRRNHITR